MKQRHHTPEQVIRKLAEGEKLLGEGKSIEEVARHLEITESTWHRWRNQYGGMKADDAKKLKELERENVRLKRIVADQALDMLKELNRETSDPVPPPACRCGPPRAVRGVGQNVGPVRLSASPGPPNASRHRFPVTKSWLYEPSYVTSHAGVPAAARKSGWVVNTTSVFTACVASKACVCLTGRGRARCAVSGWPSAPCPRSGQT